MRNRLLALTLCLIAPCAAHAEGSYLFDLLKKPTYAQAFRKMIAGVAGREKWLAERGGPAGPGGPSKAITVAGTPYELVDTCKQHDCSDNRVFIIFSTDGSRAWGILRQPRGDSFMGNPDVAQRAALLNAAQ